MSRIKSISNLPKKWVIKTKDGFYIQPNNFVNHYDYCMQYEADAFRYTQGEAVDFLDRFPELKSKAEIIQVTR